VLGLPLEGYFLRTARLGFRCWRTEDFPLALELWGDPQVTHLFSKDKLTEEQVKERLSAEIDRAKRFGLQYWALFSLAGDDHVGCCGLRPYRMEEKIYELGVHLRPQHWGKGFATEALARVIEYAFTELGASALFAGHHPSNVASGRALLKLGFKYTGEEFYEPTGLMHPSYLLRKGD
jgi:[ribosomal protein S5]-alanine N-acetyltransferase